jgi:hypothetical protein
MASTYAKEDGKLKRTKTEAVEEFFTFTELVARREGLAADREHFVETHKEALERFDEGIKELDVLIAEAERLEVEE